MQGSINKNVSCGTQVVNNMTNSQKTDGKQADGKFAPGNSIGKKFPPGSSGNPNGRPRLTKLTESLRQQLSEISPDADEQTIAESLARTLIREGLAGNVQAIKEIGDRTEGRPMQKVDLDLQVNDWRTEAQKYGVTEQDVIDEAKLLISEFAINSGSE
jgi:hypothetical protein